MTKRGLGQESSRIDQKKRRGTMRSSISRRPRGGQRTRATYKMTDSVIKF